VPYYLAKDIVVVDYDLSWPRSFEEEKERIFRDLAPLLVSIEHIGSTSVPGLAAKPIVDMLAAVRSVEDVARCGDPLGALGYLDARIQVPGRWLFCQGGPYNEGTHHLHLVLVGSSNWTLPLDFRNRLRAWPDLAREYAELKRALAALHGRDIDGYSDGKSAFIQRVIDQPL
jgi:GrpB-like predicted nucleotidyltransferase (UPF0157 family)